MPYKPALPPDLPRRFRRFAGARDVYGLDAPVYPDREGSPTFQLAYTDSGPDTGGPTLVIIPGGPGLASVIPYATLRPKAVASGFRVVMVEHRGVGLSRYTPDGEVLPKDSMRLAYAAEDLLRVLDRAGVERVWLHGTSYGGELAVVFGALFPERVAGMFLDSTWRGLRDEARIREHKRDLFLRGRTDDARLRRAAAKVRLVLERGLASDEEVASVVPPVYEFLGAEALDRLLAARLAGRTAEWRWFSGLISRELDERMPGVMEADPAMEIFYRESGSLPPDGKPFDTESIWAERADRYSSYAGPPVDPDAALRSFRWPTVLFSGERDVRTPPFVMQEMAELVPDALHLTLQNAGHDLLRFRAQEILAVERAATEGGTAAARRAAEEHVTDGSRSPLALVGSAFTGYLKTREVLARPAAKLALAAGAALGLAALARRSRA
ncbi:Alpha/beta hydrolase family [Rubrobacter radiotolerans]|uniref:Alpha/beta fold hydrolase n=1 Tax=Rubrobacter radiotolerans TaxID=42256 RepID=A0A023X509_RUBRA|nr:alpha/beta fold hydrolase [Rubrobacter radiotolerans]AHY47542.1 Alpha/beta hydrolase family [Rubrobacter radiotolerans]MDX5894945.1 alpha/beta fold hydrolase [Rubrobacter radiotolerans]SMC07129.1 Pimeloyl-ACP methyl ester carboxylesterase [Rubrobacter radiotolerans DSM 5868]